MGIERIENIQQFNRSNRWMSQEIYRIAETRFDRIYLPAVKEAIASCLETHSVVVVHPNKEKSLTAFVLVCPPTTPSADRYGIRTLIAGTAPLEIAFCATDIGWDGRGLGRSMLHRVLVAAAHQGCWLHVDTDNDHAQALYRSLGFHTLAQMPDPYGSDGILMRRFPGPL